MADNRRLDFDRPVEIAALFRLQWEESERSYVLLYPEGMVKLNASAGEILKCCDGRETANGIIKALRAAFGNSDEVERDAREFLEIAYEQGWVRNKRDD